MCMSERSIASASAGTSRVMQELAPVMAPAPMLTGATIMVSEPTKAPSPMVVLFLLTPS